MVPTTPPVPAPISNPFTTVHAWAGSQPHDVDFLVQDAAWSPTFSEQSFPAGLDEVHDLWTTGGDVSWLGGPAIAPLDDWPRSSAVTALAHVMTVALADADSAADAEAKAAWPQHAEGLSTAGALEVFHDLRAFGWERGDLLAGAWMFQRGLPQSDHPVPITQLYGHSQHSTSRALSILGDVLPVRGVTSTASPWRSRAGPTSTAGSVTPAPCGCGCAAATSPRIGSATPGASSAPTDARGSIATRWPDPRPSLIPPVGGHAG